MGLRGMGVKLLPENFSSERDGKRVPDLDKKVGAIFAAGVLEMVIAAKCLSRNVSLMNNS